MVFFSRKLMRVSGAMATALPRVPIDAARRPPQPPTAVPIAAPAPPPATAPMMAPERRTASDLGGVLPCRTLAVFDKRLRLDRDMLPVRGRQLRQLDGKIRHAFQPARAVRLHHFALRGARRALR